MKEKERERDGERQRERLINTYTLYCVYFISLFLSQRLVLYKGASSLARRALAYIEESVTFL